MTSFVLSTVVFLKENQEDKKERSNGKPSRDILIHMGNMWRLTQRVVQTTRIWWCDSTIGSSTETGLCFRTLQEGNCRDSQSIQGQEGWKHKNLRKPKEREEIIKTIVSCIEENGMSLQQTCDFLNKNGLNPINGGKWYKSKLSSFYKTNRETSPK